MGSETIDVGGVRFGIRCWGDRNNGPPMLLLHSLGEESGSWSAFAEALAPAHRVVALDLRGHGLSDRATRYSLELMRDDVLAVIDHLDLDDVCLVGHSLGGMVGYLVAMAGSRRVTRLVLEEAPAPLPLVPARPVPEDPGGDHGFDWAALADVYAQRSHPDPDWWEVLERITIPVLVVAGGPTSHVDQAEMRAMAGRIPGARLTTIQAGHDVHSRRPDELLATVRSFLEP